MGMDMEYKLIAISRQQEYTYILTFIRDVTIVQLIAFSIDEYIIGNMYRINITMPIPSGTYDKFLK